MISFLSLTLILIAIILLITLAIIDFRTYYLPNIYVFTLAVAGVLFQLITQATLLPIGLIITGALTGFFSLYLIRLIANHHYKTDTLGLGDVKLMGAAGIWLGLDGILMALTFGALAGLVHGLIYATYLKLYKRQSINFGQLNIPAGPAFIFGNFIAGIPLYKNFVLNMIATLFNI